MSFLNQDILFLRPDIDFSDVLSYTFNNICSYSIVFSAGVKDRLDFLL